MDKSGIKYKNITTDAWKAKMELMVKKYQNHHGQRILYQLIKSKNKFITTERTFNLQSVLPVFCFIGNCYNFL